MHIKQRIKLVVFVPETHADQVREAIGKAGGGKLGNYSHVTWSSKGVGRFIPEQGSNPTIGEVGKLTEVAEEKIESIVERDNKETVIRAIMEAHPYEEPAIDVYPIEEYDR